MQKPNCEIIYVLLSNGKLQEIELALKSKHANIERISEEEARENGEAEVQLEEGQTYEYSHEKGFKLICNNQVVKWSKLNSNTGTIEPGNYVGTLTFKFVSTQDQSIDGYFKLEVKSVKTDYRTDYRFMLQEIAERCTELVMQHSVPISQNFISDHNRQYKTAYQRFEFIKSMINSEEFEHAIHKIIQSPVVVWSQEERFKDVSKIKRLNSKHLRQIASNVNSSSTKIYALDKTSSVDAPENRFIKYVLQQFQDTCTLFLSRLKKKDPHEQEIIRLQEKLSQYLSHDLFKEVGVLQSIPLNSPILQRKEGYREVLKVWIMFEVASQLTWSGGEDVYEAGKKDVAALYEYWLFFKLYDTVIKIFKITPLKIEDLIESTEDGLGLKLKRGSTLHIKDICTAFSRKLNIQLSYNRTFSEQPVYPDPGSWTTQLRPDFTLSIWPMGLTSEQAEKDELITHIHFDAKYKTEYSKDEGDKDDATPEKNIKGFGNLKREDLLKMHIYKDAIRRTGGAYVLYPGTKSNLRKGFHEVLPGIGAFAITPSIDNSGIAEFEDFLSSVLELLLNRVSQKEKMALKVSGIHRTKPISNLSLSLPETIKNNRDLIPEETVILVGYYKNQNHLNWIINKKLYNTRIILKGSPAYIDQTIFAARYLLLHNRTEPLSGNFFKLKPKGARFFSKKELLQSGYPSAPTQSLYLIFDIAEEEVEPEFLQYKWDVKQLRNYTKGKGYALPFGSTLSELMLCASL